jgi:hypothetical protein
MQCPGCGYNADDTAVFCPRCRFQFREFADAPAYPDTLAVIERETISDDSIFEERQKGFSNKELKMLEVQLVQSAILVALIFSLFIYTLIWTTPFIPVTYAGLSFGLTGPVCIACGLLAGLVFFFFTRRSLVRFRFR